MLAVGQEENFKDEVWEGSEVPSEKKSVYWKNFWTGLLKPLTTCLNVGAVSALEVIYAV